MRWTVISNETNLCYLGGLRQDLRVTKDDIKMVITTVSILIVIFVLFDVFVARYNDKHKVYTQ